MTNRIERRLWWISVDQAARLAAASAATIRSWVRRGSIRSEAAGGQTMVRLDDVVNRALHRTIGGNPSLLKVQAEAALQELETMARELAKAAGALDELHHEAEEMRARASSLEEQYARRAQWAQRQHEREMREVYAQWEQERAQWDQERGRFAAEPAGVPEPVGVPELNSHAATAQVTSRPPVADDVLPPLHFASTPPPPSTDITPGRGRAWWRQLRT